MVNAAGAAALSSLAPGRVAVAFGTGWTGRRAMGVAAPITWSYMRRYITAFRSLLRGEVAEWDGAEMRMLHGPDSMIDVPVEVPIYIGAIGPKGLEVAQHLGDGLFVASGVPEGASGFESVAYLVWGTVLEESEDTAGDRVRAAAGPGVMQTYHATYEVLGPDGMSKLPGGAAWLDVINRSPDAQRHLAVHQGHCLRLNDADTAAWDQGASSLVEHTTLSGTVLQIRAKVAAYADQGVTELVCPPTGDIPRELEAFAAATQPS